MTMKIQKILIDCDPGGDDVFALLWLLINHKFAHLPMEVIGITTAWWNVNAQATYLNALRMCQFVWIDTIPVGKDHRQIQSTDASHIHGEDGIGWLASMLEPVIMPNTDIDSVDMLVEAIQTHGSDLTILTTGPLTNLALAEQRVPGILSQCHKIIAMGGAVAIHGNITPVAEFNIAYDPESAKIVFDSTENIILAPLDLTTSAVFSEADLQQCFTQINNSDKQEFMRKLTDFVIGTNMKFRETWYEHGFYVHDAHTVWLLLYPHLYQWSFYQLQIETRWEFTRGQTVVDFRNHAHTSVNCFIAMNFNKNLFLESFTQDLRQFDFS